MSQLAAQKSGYKTYDFRLAVHHDGFTSKGHSQVRLGQAFFDTFMVAGGVVGHYRFVEF